VLLLAACRPPGWGKDPPDVDAGEASPDADDTPAPDAAPADPDATPTTCEHGFRLEGQGSATSVWLTGDFVGWAGNPGDGAIALALGVDAAWTATHTFDAGSYQYKFIVDGSTWMADPANPDQISDGLGGFNSVYVCE
jgi:hypothetical protein